MAFCIYSSKGKRNDNILHFVKVNFPLGKNNKIKIIIIIIIIIRENMTTITNLIFTKLKLTNFYKYSSKIIHKILNYKTIYTFPDKCKKEKVTICDY